MDKTDNLLKVGTFLNHGKYKIVCHLASGGFGNTYEAINTVFEAKCAIKEFYMSGINHRADDSLSVEISNSAMNDIFETAKRKFKKEAQRLYSIQNEHIVRVHDMFEENNTVYYVMDFIEGNSLNKLMKQQGHSFNENQCKRILLQMCDALKCIHAQKLWHMDIKPGNIMMDNQGKCTLIDFGASKQTDLDNGKTVTASAIAQTPGYAPSEQINGNYDHWGPWTDFYALGATLYNLITDKRPPLRDDIDIEQEKAFSFSDDVSQVMRNLIISMMQPIYIRRPQNVDEILQIANFDFQGKQPINEQTKLEDSNKTIYAPIKMGELNTSKFTVNGVSFTMVQVIGGTFTMGATKEQIDFSPWKDEFPTHRVALSSYNIGQTVVTQELWQAVMGFNQSFFEGNLRPVEKISWFECQLFLDKLKMLTGQNFRLPTEAEWEYAARGGNKSKEHLYSGSNSAIDVAWFSEKETHDVANKKPNELGIYDMSGNVGEWCQDWYDKYSSETLSNPLGGSSGLYRVVRGGAWDDGMWRCRVSYRNNCDPNLHLSNIGLRLAL